MLDARKVRAIGLDLDDTLWPIWPTIARAEDQLHQWLLPQAPGAARMIHDATQRLALRDALVRERPEIAHDMTRLRQEIIRQALARCAEDPSLAEPAFAVFYEHRMRVDLFDDALAALQELAGRYPVVAVSNGNADVGRIGIGAHFRASVSAHVLGVAKPDVRIFHAAAAAAGVPPEAVLHVGDDPALDVLGGLDAGMQTIWVNRDGKSWSHDRQPHATVTDLQQLCVMLRPDRAV